MPDHGVSGRAGQTTVLVVERGQTTVLVVGLGSSLVAIYFSSLTRVGLWAHWSMSLASVHMRLIYVVFTQRTSSPNEIRMFQDHQDTYLNGVVVRGGLGCSGVLPSHNEPVTLAVPKKGRKKSNRLTNIEYIDLRDLLEAKKAQYVRPHNHNRKSIVIVKSISLKSPKFMETSMLEKMNVKDARDAMKCGAFPLLLERSAKDWFKSLKPNSISSFDLLKQSFLNQFLSASKKRYPPIYLLSIRQGPKEKLGPFMFHVNKLPPKSYGDLVSEACHLAIAEEMTYDTPEGKDPSQPSVRDKQRKDQNGGKGRDQPQNLFRSRFDNYTPLNTN
ncbi:unnamed protein product [Prunus brigantina]